MLDKLKSNMEEVQARGGELFVFADENSGIKAKDRQHVVLCTKCECITCSISCIAFQSQLLSLSCCCVYVEQMSISHVTWRSL